MERTLRQATRYRYRLVCWVCWVLAVEMTDPLKRQKKSTMEMECSRQKSREARLLITKLLANADVKTFPEDCALDPSKEIYRYQEANIDKSMKRDSNLKCLFCGKKFKSQVDARLLSVTTYTSGHAHLSSITKFSCDNVNTPQFYMDRHMTRNHEDKITSNSTVCIAEFCEVWSFLVRTTERARPCKDLFRSLIRF
jgi:hypothetical protein